MKPICPRLGHLVRVREGSALARDIDPSGVYGAEISHAWQNCGIVVATRGIEVQVLLAGEMFSWVRRDNVEVISTCKV
jgi:hypothetical protein